MGNLDLDRSKFSSFILYLPRFALYSLWALAWRQFGGLFTMYYAMYPFIESVVFFGGISYLWHAWCEPGDINNPYIDSVTIVNGKDNIFNEDFHVVHHTKPMAHWTDYPTLYKDSIAEYEKYNATIFTDCEEGEMSTGSFRKSGTNWPTTWSTSRAR